MSDDLPVGQDLPASTGVFRAKIPEGGGVPLAAWLIAGALVLLIAGALAFSGRHKGSIAANQQRPLDAYAASLPLSQLAMSESTSLSGGKSTFMDGKVKNVGAKTVTGVTVQVIFRNDENLAPQIETLPLSLIRMRQPYIDTGPVSAAPLKPGDEQDFRLIFETIATNWNTQMPEVNIVAVTTR